MSKSDAQSTLLDRMDSDSPTEIRREVAEFARISIGAEAAVFCRYGVDDRGQLHRAIESVGNRELCASIDARFDEHPRDPLWDPRDPPSAFEETFGVVSYGPDGDIEGATESRRDGLQKLDVGREGSALLYDGRHCLGWLGTFETGAGDVDSARGERLDGLIGAATGALIKAEKRDSFLYRETPAQFVFDSASHEVEYESANARMWLTERRRDRVMTAFDEQDSRDFVSDRFVVDGYAIRTMLLSGDPGIRVLATVEQLPLPKKRVDAVLTPRQRDVAEHAASGATNREIAETLDITPDTVSDHLTEAYDRLGVGNRVELTVMLRRSE